MMLTPDDPEVVPPTPLSVAGVDFCDQCQPQNTSTKDMAHTLPCPTSDLPLVALTTAPTGPAAVSVVCRRVSQYVYMKNVHAYRQCRSKAIHRGRKARF